MLGWIVILAFAIALSAYILPLVGGAIGLGILIAFLVLMFRFAKHIATAIHEDIMEFWDKHTGKTEERDKEMAQFHAEYWDRIAKEDGISDPSASAIRPTRHSEDQDGLQESL